jgi:hypothetical protein
MKIWISEHRGWLTTATATLALIIAIVALVVGITAGGDDRGGFAFGDGAGPPQGVIAPGTMVPPGVQPGSGTPGYPDPSGSGSGNGSGSGSAP